jgi:hypothetical protein
MFWIAGLVVLWPTLPLAADEPTTTKETTFDVPYRLTEVQHVLVRAKINGKGPFNFIVDTGAPALFVAVPVCKKLDIKADRYGWGTFDRFEIEGGVVEQKARGRVETPFQLEGMNGLGLAGAELHGIIGYNLLARYRLEFDFTKDKMKWTQLSYNPPPPVGLGGKGSAAGGLDALGSLMKWVGAFLGKKSAPELVFRGFFGMELAAADDAIEVKSVLAKSPANQAGLQAGDRITHFQNKAVASLADVHRLSRAITAGKAARLRVTRGTDTKEITVKLGEGL